MGWLKKDLVKKAFERIGLADYVFDMPPEQLSATTVDMDMMIADWNLSGIRLGWPMPSTPGDSDPEMDSGLPDMAVMAVVDNLALLIAGKLGRAVMPHVVRSANNGKQSLLRRSAQPSKRHLPRNMPAGAGHKTWRGQPGRPFLDSDDNNSIGTGDDGELPFK